MMMMRYYLGLLADACLRAGRIDDGLVAIAEASETAAELGEWLSAAELLRLKGELLLARSPKKFDPPEECFHDLSISPAVSARRRWSFGRRWRSPNCGGGKVAKIDALELLSPVYAWFTEGFENAGSEGREGAIGRAGVSDEQHR